MEAQKKHFIHKWKNRGLIGDYDAIYDKYINSEYCDLCKKRFINSYNRCMDHCHLTGHFRHICCRTCNSNMPKQNPIPKSGHRYISYNKKNDAWRFDKVFYKKRYIKNRKSKIQLLCYKYIVMLQIAVIRKKMLKN